MKIVPNLNSAIEREETPHSINSNQPVSSRIAVAYRRRAESVISDVSVDGQSRAIIRYALETHDPWLAELVRRVDAGESLIDNVDFSQEPQTRYDDDFEVEKFAVVAN